MCARNNPQISSKRPLLCYVTDRNTLAKNKSGGSVDLLLQKIGEIISADIDWVQIREKDLSSKELSRVVHNARSAAEHSAGPTPPRILVNDRLDVALATGASGVHLGGDSLRVEDAKNLVRGIAPVQIDPGVPQTIAANDFLIGVSCHSREDAETAAAGADYIFFGPIFTTPSKAAFGAPQGLDRLTEVCRAVSIPVIAIGGITLENAASCFSAGAAGIAAIRLFQDAPEPRLTVRGLRALMDSLRQPPVDR